MQAEREGGESLPLGAVRREDDAQPTLRDIGLDIGQAEHRVGLDIGLDIGQAEHIGLYPGPRCAIQAWIAARIVGLWIVAQLPTASSVYPAVASPEVTSRSAMSRMASVSI